MAEYKVIKDFTDLEDDGHVYSVNDPFPRKGKSTKKRIESLSTENNKRNEVLIKVVEEDDTEFPSHTGGGYYELSNGEKVQGKDNAIESEKALQE